MSITKSDDIVAICGYLYAAGSDIYDELVENPLDSDCLWIAQGESITNLEEFVTKNPDDQPLPFARNTYKLTANVLRLSFKAVGALDEPLDEFGYMAFVINCHGVYDVFESFSGRLEAIFLPRLTADEGGYYNEATILTLWSYWSDTFYTEWGENELEEEWDLLGAINAKGLRILLIESVKS